MSAVPHEPAAIGFDPEIAFYRHVMRHLRESGVEFLVGGAYAFAAYTGIERNTKDLDLFVRRDDYDVATRALACAGYATRLTFPHWLGKVHHGVWFVDLIFNSGNGATPVDEAWFEHAIAGDVFDMQAKIVPVEEMIWSKAFLMERERYDGADVAHLLRARTGPPDWVRLVERFGSHWRVLLAHLVLFGFVYPDERTRIPAHVMTTLLDRLAGELDRPAGIGRVCAGTLLSREQYLHDIGVEGYLDGRAPPLGTMSAEAIAAWTEAIDDE